MTIDRMRSRIYADFFGNTGLNMLDIRIRRHTVAAFFIVSAALPLFFAERTFSSHAWVWLQGAGVIALLWYLRLVYKRQRAVLFTSFYQTFYWLGILASATAISAGTFMIEIEQSGTANGTFWVALIFLVMGMEMTVFGFRAAGRPIRGLEVVRFSPGLNTFFIFAATGVTLALSAYVFFVYQGPILTDENRVTFWRTAVPSALAFVPNLVTQSFFFAAYYFLWEVRGRKSRLLAGAVVLGYLFTGLFVLGQKFSLYIIFINAWLFLVAGLLPEYRVKRRDILLAVAVGTAMIFTVTAFYLTSGREIGFILTRIALQAQLLWSVLEDGGALSLLPQQWSCFWGCEGFADGRDYISYLYLPEARYEHYAATGSALSGFTPALPFATFGLAATAVLYLFASFILGWLQRKAVNAFRRDNMIYGFMIFKLQFGLSMLVATGSLATLRGIAIMAIAIPLYHVLFARTFWRRSAQA